MFPCDWATVLVGWRGAGACSPWPDDWERFPPMITQVNTWATDPKAHYEESQCAVELAECRKWLESEVASICRCNNANGTLP